MITFEGSIDLLRYIVIRVADHTLYLRGHDILNGLRTVSNGKIDQAGDTLENTPLFHCIIFIQFIYSCNKSLWPKVQIQIKVLTVSAIHGVQMLLIYDILLFIN